MPVGDLPHEHSISVSELISLTFIGEKCTKVDELIGDFPYFSLTYLFVLKLS